MSKYKPLWEYIKNKQLDNETISFKKAENILNFEIDHSFLTFKKELLDYGYSIKKISMKDKTILVEKIKH